MRDVHAEAQAGKVVKVHRDFNKGFLSLLFFSLYSNMISDEGAKSLAAVLPHMASLTDLE